MATAKQKSDIENTEVDVQAENLIEEVVEPDPTWEVSEHINNADLWYGQPSWLVSFMLLNRQGEPHLSKAEAQVYIDMYLNTEVKG